MNNKYNIYTGYVADETEETESKYASKQHAEFFKLWYSNTRRYEPNAQIFIHGPDVPDLTNTTNTYSIAQYQNLGHVHDYVNKKRFGKWCGAVAGMVYGMMHAYLQNVDFVYKEQDCLIVGDCINQMYQEIGENGIIFGDNKMFRSAQALFLVKRNYVPLMIKQLAEVNDADVLPEYKFLRLKYSCRFSFGYDRDRPYNKTDKCFYIQQIKPNELEDLQNSNLI